MSVTQISEEAARRLFPKEFARWELDMEGKYKPDPAGCDVFYFHGDGRFGHGNTLDMFFDVWNPKRGCFEEDDEAMRWFEPEETAR